jgi:hypothetical protein
VRGREIEVAVLSVDTAPVTLIPNPVTAPRPVNLRRTQPRGDAVTVDISDMTGRRVFTRALG